jgi:hypothetical protein
MSDDKNGPPYPPYPVIRRERGRGVDAIFEPAPPQIIVPHPESPFPGSMPAAKDGCVPMLEHISERHVIDATSVGDGIGRTREILEASFRRRMGKDVIARIVIEIVEPAAAPDSEPDLPVDDFDDALQTPHQPG